MQGCGIRALSKWLSAEVANKVSAAGSMDLAEPIEKAYSEGVTMSEIVMTVV